MNDNKKKLETFFLNLMKKAIDSIDCYFKTSLFITRKREDK